MPLPSHPPPPFYPPGFASPPGFAGGFPSAAAGSFDQPAGFRISRDAFEDGYGLTIHAGGADPATIEVRAEGQSLIISRERSEQRFQEDSYEEGHGFVRSFSYSSGSASLRLPVPPDADLSAMTREDGKEGVRITIPRRAASNRPQTESR
jgi:HSP20 family molecular chaperone IbpA